MWNIQYFMIVIIIIIIIITIIIAFIIIIISDHSIFKKNGEVEPELILFLLEGIWIQCSAQYGYPCTSNISQKLSFFQLFIIANEKPENMIY